MTSDRPGIYRIGTRSSPLALAQARLVAAAMAQAHALTPGQVQLVPVQTVGDKVQDRPLAEIGGKALWTKELDRALLDGGIDFAVHSMKDVETALHPGIVVAAVLEREDPRDRLVGVPALAALRPGAVVGTSSPRRAAQLLNRRPDVRVVSLRGNVETRLRHIAEGRADATFLAAAGLKRLGIEAGSPIPIDVWLPAAAQGIIGITCRADDAPMARMLAAISHAPTMACLLAERAVLEGLGGSCHTSVAVHAAHAPSLGVRAELLGPDGRDRVDAHMQGEATPRDLGLALAVELLRRATPAIRASLAPGGMA